MANGHYQLPVIDTLSDAWNKVYGAKSTIWAAFGLYILIMIGTGVIVAILKMISPGLSTVVNIVLQIYLSLAMFGLYYIGYMRSKDAPINFKMLFRGVEEPRRSVKLVLALLLTYLILLPPIVLAVLAGMGAAMGGADSSLIKIFVGLIYIVCITATLFLLIRVSLAILFVLDRDVGPVEAVKLSFRATKRNVQAIISIYILSCLIVMISAIPLGIGLIWTMPFIYIVTGTVYKRLQVNVM